MKKNKQKYNRDFGKEMPMNIKKRINEKFYNRNIIEFYPLSGKGRIISCTPTGDSLDVSWGDLKYKFNYEAISDILDNFFKDDSEWYPLGASMTEPMPGGLGEYIKDNYVPLTPRHASSIASVMVSIGLLEFKGQKPIFLRKTV